MRTDGHEEANSSSSQFCELAYDSSILEAKIHSELWYLRQGRNVIRKAVFSIEGKMPLLQVKFRIIYNFTHEFKFLQAWLVHYSPV
jgi:hypothetical protein